MSASWSARGWSRLRSSGACGPAGSAGAGSPKRRPGSTGAAGSGTHASTRWTTSSRPSNGRRRQMGDRASKGRTAVERRSERELVVTRVFDAPVRLVFDAWTKPELFKLWWAPKSNPVPLLSCEMDVRTGGGYRLAFGHDAASAMAFFGSYLEVTPPSRLVWTNEESDDTAVTTVTFEENDGR